MFGQNTIQKKRFLDSGQSLEVKEIFPTIQGEGPYAGRPAVFVRLGGCNLRCHYCDTDFENGEMLSLNEVIRRVHDMANTEHYHADLVVITGGEPLRQNIVFLIDRLTDELEMEVQIETAGTLWQDGLEHLIARGDVTLVCSPKTPQVHEQVERLCRHYKYIIARDDSSDRDGLPVNGTQVRGTHQPVYRPADVSATIWVQPRADYMLPLDPLGIAEQAMLSKAPVPDPIANARNVAHASSVAMLFNYRLSLQLHKILNLP